MQTPLARVPCTQAPCTQAPCGQDGLPVCKVQPDAIRTRKEKP
jgi:hypothetical protein